MPSFSVVDEAKAQEISCAICLMPWNDPVEIQPCRHVFCKACCIKVNKCPDCRGEITNRSVPNRILVNMSKEIEMKCDDCGVVVANENTHKHKCDGAAAKPSQQTAPAAQNNNFPNFPQPQATPPQQQQPPHQAPPQNWNAPAPNNVAPQWQQQPMAAPPMQQQQMPPTRYDPSKPWTKYDIPQEEYDHIMCVFMTFDTDGSGSLERKELAVLCRWLNYAHSPQDIERMFQEMDTDRSGSLDLEEFCTWLSKHKPDPQTLYGLSPVEYQNVLFAFHSYDGDQNGTLNQNEFVQLCMKQHYVQNPSEGAALFRAIDTDQNGQVDLNELLMYRSRQRNGGSGAGRAPQPPGQQAPRPGSGAGPMGPSGPPQQAPANNNNLPPGWSQFWDGQSGRYYYVEMATQRTTWDPPGTNTQQQPKAPMPPPQQQKQPPAVALPPGWQQFTDPKTGRAYFVNTANGQTTWTPPTQPNGAPYPAANTNKGPMMQPQQAGGGPGGAAWPCPTCTFVNQAASPKCGVCEAPRPGGSGTNSPASPHNGYPQRTASNVGPAPQRPGSSQGGGPYLPEGWITQHDSQSGRMYYVHTPTGRTQWEPPTR